MWLKILGAVGAGIVTLAVLYRKKLEKTFGSHDVKDEINVNGKIVLITGGNSGLGKEMAKEMATRGAVVVIASRDMSLSENVVQEIRSHTTGAHVNAMKLDLGSIDDIHRFVNEFKKKYDHINILVNCAGLACPLSKGLKTKDGFEINLGVNHIGHFLLTDLLLEEIKRGAPSRILIVASTLSENVEINFEDLMLSKVDSKSQLFAYSHSKLANILYSHELSKRLQGSGVNTYALCPGWVKTNLARSMDLRWWNYIIMIPAVFMFMRSSQQGVQTLLHCALSKRIANDTGNLYRNCEYWKTKSKITDEKARRLWEETEKLLQSKK